VLLSFPAKDPALIGRCYRRLIAPLSGPIRDQDLRVVAQVLRLSVVLAAIEVAVAVSHVLIRLGQFPHAAEEVPAREILLGVTEIFPCHAEVLGGFTEVIMAVVAVVAMVAVVTVVTMMAVVVVVIEDIVQETSDETSRKTWQQTEHELFSIVARGACACLMPTLRCLLTVRLRQKQIRPSVICSTPDPSQRCSKLIRLPHARRRLKCCPSRGIACQRRCDCGGRVDLNMGFAPRCA